MAKKPDYIAALPTDEHGLPLSWSGSPYSATFQTNDGSKEAVNSPLSLTKKITTLTIPKNGVAILIRVSADRVKISEKKDMGTYFQLDTNEEITLSVANTEYIYLCSVSASATVSFSIEMIC
jgi:hypothetical protein